ncbi:unnamed protein product, partial [Ixodes pacificus]
AKHGCRKWRKHLVVHLLAAVAGLLVAVGCWHLRLHLHYCIDIHTVHQTFGPPGRISHEGGELPSHLLPKYGPRKLPVTANLGRLFLSDIAAEEHRIQRISVCYSKFPPL